jgi:Ca2+-transporting ATPase
MPRPLAVRLISAGILLAVATLIVVAIGEEEYGLPVATTMGLVTLSLLNVVAAIIGRDPDRSAIGMHTIDNRRFNLLILACLVLTLLVTELNFLQRIFDTVTLTSEQWGICLLAVAVTAAILEAGKFVLRRTGWASTAPEAAEAKPVQPSSLQDMQALPQR